MFSVSEEEDDDPADSMVPVEPLESIDADDGLGSFDGDVGDEGESNEPGRLSSNESLSGKSIRATLKKRLGWDGEEEWRSDMIRAVGE